MPEGTEVKWMVDQINREIVQKKSPCRLLEVEITSGRYITHSLPAYYQEFNQLLKKGKIYLSDLQSKGKFIYLTFTNSEWSIWITLGMSGHLILEEWDHTRCRFRTSNGDFYLDDMRNFGTLTFCPTADCLEKKLASLGPDLLQDQSLTAADFIEIIRKMKSEKIIALALVDQKKLAGIGNYLRAEVLYQAKISPFKKLKDLSDEELKRLFKAIRKVMTRSYQIQSKDGIHKYPFMVYQREKDPEGNPVKGEKLPDKRQIWWVPKVQH